MRRRPALRVVATGLTAALTSGLAGCTQFTPSVGGCGEETTLRLRPVTPETVAKRSATPMDSFPAFDRRLATEALNESEATYVARARKLPHSQYISADGSFYRLTQIGGESVTTTGSVYRLVRTESTDGEVAASEVVALDTLPDADQKTLLAALGPIEKLNAGAEVDQELVAAYPDESTRETSALVPEFDGEAVDVEGIPVRLLFVETRRVSVTTFTVFTAKVADSPAAFLYIVVSEGAYPTFDDLSPDERDIVEAAIEDTYDECAPYSDAYERILTRIGGAEWNAGRSDYVRYDGEWYSVEASSFIA